MWLPGVDSVRPRRAAAGLAVCRVGLWEAVRVKAAALMLAVLPGPS